MLGAITWVFILFWDLKTPLKLFGAEDTHIGDGIARTGIIVHPNVISKPTQGVEGSSDVTEPHDWKVNILSTFIYRYSECSQEAVLWATFKQYSFRWPSSVFNR